MFHPLPTCSQTGHHQSKLGLVLLLCHVVERPAQVLLGLGQSVGAHLQPRALGDDLGGVAALGDPDVAVGWVGISLAFKEHQLSRVDGEHLSCPQALARVHLQVVGAICRGQQWVRETWQFAADMVLVVQSGYFSMNCLILMHHVAAAAKRFQPQGHKFDLVKQDPGGEMPLPV